MPATTDRIEKQIGLSATPDRVWRAISTASEFGEWFGVRFDGEFVPGAKLRGKITTPGCDHMECDIYIETVEPQRLFSYRWHAHAWDPNLDYSNDPTTLVEFRLEAVDEGTRLTITESGFDNVPEPFRVEAFTRNEGGWAMQIKNIERYVSAS